MIDLVLQWWSFAVLGVVLFIASWTDVRSGIIPRQLTYPAIAVGLIGHTLTGGLTGAGGGMQFGLLGALAGFAVGFLPMMAVFFTGGIGGGDVKLMGAIGALAGWRFTLTAMFFGFGVAVVMALVILLRRRMALAVFKRILQWFWVVLSFGKAYDPATEDSPKLPFGLALCLGSAVALIEVLIRGPVARKLFLGV
ncbi:MAG: prepilin peptidase [Phycisphaerae bacterium]